MHFFPRRVYVLLFYSFSRLWRDPAKSGTSKPSPESSAPPEMVSEVEPFSYKGTSQKGRSLIRKEGKGKKMSQQNSILIIDKEVI